MDGAIEANLLSEQDELRRLSLDLGQTRLLLDHLHIIYGSILNGRALLDICHCEYECECGYGYDYGYGYGYGYGYN
jgi:hypothetical protein